MADETSGTTTKKSAKKDDDEGKKLSSDARHSNYRQATDDDLDNADPVLPPGPHVIQEPGEPSEGADAGFKFANKS